MLPEIIQNTEIGICCGMDVKISYFLRKYLDELVKNLYSRLLVLLYF